MIKSGIHFSVVIILANEKEISSIVHCIFENNLSFFWQNSLQKNINKYHLWKIIYLKLILALGWNHCCAYNQPTINKDIDNNWMKFIGKLNTNWFEFLNNCTFSSEISSFSLNLFDRCWMTFSSVWESLCWCDISWRSRVTLIHMHLFAQLCWCIALPWKFLFSIYRFILIHLACVCSYWHAIQNLNKKVCCKRSQNHTFQVN